MTIAEFDHLNVEEKKSLLYQCCGSASWVNKMLGTPPAEDLVDLMEIAEEQWYACSEADWLEAFAQHPKIGDLSSLKDEYAATARWTAAEQAAVQEAGEATLQDLVTYNALYENKFGFIFIVCATGQQAANMLHLLKTRLKNSRNDELKIAAEEQIKITKLRLEKLFAI